MVNKQQQKTQKTQKQNKQVVVAKSTQPGITKVLKDVIPGGVKLIGDMIEPGLGTLGDVVTRKAMDLFGKITGFGDYDVKVNSLIADPTNANPLPAKFGDGSIRKRGTDFIKFVKVKAGGAFKLDDTFFISPSNPKLFPKLSIEAQLYQKSILHGAIIRLESACSESISTNNGDMSIPTLIVAALYNLKESDFQDEVEMLNTYLCSDKRVNKDFLHPIECDRSQQPTNVLLNWAQLPLPGYVRDPQFENLGKLFVAHIGGTQSSDFTAYKMYIDYDVEFLQPIVRKTIQMEDHYQSTSLVSGNNLGAGVMTSSSTSKSFYEPLYTISGNTITFNDSAYGNFEVGVYVSHSSGTAGTGGTWTKSGLITDLNVYKGDTVAQITTGTNTSTAHFSCYSFKVKGAGSVTLADMAGINNPVVDIYIESQPISN